MFAGRSRSFFLEVFARGQRVHNTYKNFRFSHTNQNFRKVSPAMPVFVQCCDDPDCAGRRVSKRKWSHDAFVAPPYPDGVNPYLGYPPVFGSHMQMFSADDAAGLAGTAGTVKTAPDTYKNVATVVATSLPMSRTKRRSRMRKRSRMMKNARQ